MPDQTATHPPQTQGFLPASPHVVGDVLTVMARINKLRISVRVKVVGIRTRYGKRDYFLHAADLPTPTHQDCEWVQESCLEYVK